jgi:hypothetical protein
MNERRVLSAGGRDAMSGWQVERERPKEFCARRARAAVGRRSWQRRRPLAAGMADLVLSRSCPTQGEQVGNQLPIQQSQTSDVKRSRITPRRVLSPSRVSQVSLLRFATLHVGSESD